MSDDEFMKPPVPSNYDDKLIIAANEKLLKSKGFMLFLVTEDGKIDYSGNSERLNVAETLGLRFWVKAFEPNIHINSNRPPAPDCDH